MSANGRVKRALRQRGLRDRLREICSIFTETDILRDIIFLDSTTSTNDVALDLIKTIPAPEGIIIIADSQTAGRGRFRRKWISPPGINVYFTAILRAPEDPRDTPLSGLVCAIATAEAIRECSGIRAEIKWPNDVIINHRKTAGVLVETRTGAHGIEFLVAGIGINVNMDQEMFPKEIKDVSTSIMMEAGREIDRVKILRSLIINLDILYKKLLDRDKQAIKQSFNQLNFLFNKEIMIDHNGVVYSGIAMDIDDHGCLHVRLDSHHIKTFISGEVTILRHT